MLKNCCPNLRKIAVLLLVITLLFLKLGKHAAFAENISNPKTSDITPAFNATKTANLSEFDRQYKDKLSGVFSILHITSCVLIGEKCGENITNAKTEPFYKEGLIGVAQNLMIVPYSYPPASFSYSITTALHNTFPASPVYAQTGGLGLTTLSAFSKFWAINRNIAYSLIILLLTITGFMLIFRYKIEANTSIQLEKVMTRTVIVILVITFSYTIAGLLIDFMYLLLLMIFSVAKQNNLFNAQAIETLYGHVTPEEIFNYITLQSDPNVFVQNFLAIIPTTFRTVTEGFLSGILSLQLYPSVASMLHDFATLIETAGGISFIGSGTAEFDPGAMVANAAAFPVSGVLASVITPMIIRLVLTIAIYFALLFLYFKILFLLIGSYIEIIFSVLFSPFMILIDIIPGKNHSALWLKRLFANVITFPLLAILFLAGANITQAIGTNSSAFLPPPLSGINQGILASLVGIGILISIPTMIDRVKKWIVPDYALVNFPSTPGAFMGTIASIIPFLPVISGGYGTLMQGVGKILPFSQKNKPMETPPVPHVPHMPHQS